MKIGQSTAYADAKHARQRRRSHAGTGVPQALASRSRRAAHLLDDGRRPSATERETAATIVAVLCHRAAIFAGLAVKGRRAIQQARRAVYLHFASRGELLAALFDYLNEVEDQDTAFRPLWEAADGIAALDARARVAADFLPRIMPTARAIQQATRHDPEATRHWEPATAFRYQGVPAGHRAVGGRGPAGPAVDGPDGGTCSSR